MDLLRRALNSEFRWSKDSPNQWEIVSLLEKDKKSMYRGARMWYLVRKYLPYYYPVLFLVFMILSLTVYQTVEGSLVLGSILSLLMSSSVLASYIMIIPWRKHPSTLVLYRALTSILFSITILFEAISTTQDACRTYAVFTQFSMLAGECWLTTIALDLVYSLTNPFISYKSNLKKYHSMVWIFTGLLTFIFYCDSSCQGQFDQGICWVNITSTNSPCLWGYFLFWVVCMYVYQIYASIYAYLRLKKGLPITFDVRVKCAKETFTILTAYAVYLSFLVFLFIIISSDPAPDKNSGMSKFALFYLFLLSNKGSLDGIVWFYLHDFPHEKQLQEQYDKKFGTDRKSQQDFSQNVDNIEVEDEDETDSLLSSHLVQRSVHKKDAKNIRHIEEKLKEGVAKTLTELADLAISEFDESDLSPQVNTALRTQIVQYVTTGVRNSVLRTNIGNKPNSEISDIMDNAFKRSDPAVMPGLQVLEFLLDKEYPFKAFAPDLFDELRRLEGIDPETYTHVLSQSANERLSEGASGAFMFFCGGGEYIVKTIRAREAAVLHSFLPVYASYIKRHADSLLCRFLGSYSLEVYSQTFYFVVMLNCFDPTAYINERFDIKGSWVGRSAEPGKKTKRQVCRHCNEYFVPAKQTQCKAVVGNHEANVVLKDNDLRTKISLPPGEAANVLKILKRDSELLGKLGVIDYSLLIGVKKWKFGVEITSNMVDFNPSASPAKQSNGHKGPKSTFHAHTVTGPAVYHFGIIDFLQNWTFQKRVERAFKIYFTRKDPDGLSVMPPLPYKARFQAKLEQIFDVEGVIGGIGGVSVARVPPLKPPHRNRIPNSSNTENRGDESHVIEMTAMQTERLNDDAFDFVPMVSMPKLDLQHSLDLGRTKNSDFDDFEEV
jgi:1-phosphatidylinositol-4-phosphate 5-kinase